MIQSQQDLLHLGVLQSVRCASRMTQSPYSKAPRVSVWWIWSHSLGTFPKVHMERTIPYVARQTDESEHKGIDSGLNFFHGRDGLKKLFQKSFLHECEPLSLTRTQRWRERVTGCILANLASFGRNRNLNQLLYNRLVG